MNKTQQNYLTASGQNNKFMKQDLSKIMESSQQQVGLTLEPPQNPSSSRQFNLIN
jgi:hypothetical protein